MPNSIVNITVNVFRNGPRKQKNEPSLAGWVMKVNVKEKVYQLFTTKYLSEEAA